ncbi:type IV pili twitching motility protein PilT [Candidatus Tenderia electrophaga]|jgi:twitching motility protein PilU|uniref:Type IV pili twitching motility protein PilT n=1 Tax=Candidatus Tenderia electrophaga TaxID=1748243 RepID=A0A0S2TH83_9GAMM|nr:type IV pili twitching motility protein PilT [Candidatus Tenderia electrophaga]
MDILPFLKIMMDKNASDLYFTTNAVPCIKIEGVTAHLGHNPLPPGAVQKLAYSIMTDEQIKEFEQTMEMDMAISAKDIGRFRINVFRQRGEVAMVARYIKADIASVQSLNLPPILEELVMAARGLVLVVGTTGSGKSTTLAAMIEHRNRHKTGHILTIEDPIEYLHQHRQAIVNQREVGLDTLSYAHALKRAMREAPDVIMIGEIRDQETMQQALAYADTGHLCLSTLHATNATQTLERIINFFPENAQRQLYMDLSLNLRAIVSQRLVAGVDRKRLPAVEVMLNTPHIADLIQKGKINDIMSAVEQGANIGMQTFDQALYQLYEAGKVTVDEALNHADSRNDLSLRIRLSKDGGVDADDMDGYSLS